MSKEQKQVSKGFRDPAGYVGYSDDDLGTIAQIVERAPAKVIILDETDKEPTRGITGGRVGSSADIKY